MTFSRRLKVRLLSLLGYRRDTNNLNEKYSSATGMSRGKLPLFFSAFSIKAKEYLRLKEVSEDRAGFIPFSRVPGRPPWETRAYEEGV